jgi:uncharacterized protein (UPF0261 family)
MTKKIVLIGTADTKSDEIEYLKQKIENRGLHVIVMDIGVMGEPPFEPEINHRQVAEASGVTIEEIAAYNDEDKAMRKMTEGAIRLTMDLHGNGDLDGVLAIGGTMATDTVLDVMAALPLGVPKLIVSSVAFSHLISPDRICADLMMALWAGGLWGLNSICKQVLNSAAGAISGAAEAYTREEEIHRPSVAVTSLGQSCCKYLTWLKPGLEERGYEVVVFHAVGMGGRALEYLIANGRINALLDLSAVEVSDHALGSIVSAGQYRMESAGEMGIPQIVAPSCIDGCDVATWQPLPPRFIGRTIHVHNRLISAVATTKEEKAMVGKVMAEKLNKSVGPTAVVIPMQGLSEWDRPGSDLYDPEGIISFANAFKEKIKPEIEVVELDAHLNDKIFSDTVLSLFDKMMSKHKSQSKVD